MKLLKIAAISGLALASLSIEQVAGMAAPAPRFPTATGRVVYRMSSTGPAAMAGTISMLWAQSGQKFRQDSRLKVRASGQSMNVNTWTIFDGKALYTAMPKLPGAPASAANQVFRMKLPPNYLSQMAGGGMMGAAGGAGAGKVVGRGTILGKPCVVRVSSYSNAQGKGRLKAWSWQNLPLRTEMDMQFKAPRGGARTPPLRIVMLATKLDASAQATPSSFRLPRGAKIQDIQLPTR